MGRPPAPMGPVTRLIPGCPEGDVAYNPACTLARHGGQVWKLDPLRPKAPHGGAAGFCFTVRSRGQPTLIAAGSCGDLDNTPAANEIRRPGSFSHRKEPRRSERIETSPDVNPMAHGKTNRPARVSDRALARHVHAKWSIRGLVGNCWNWGPRGPPPHKPTAMV